jgi:hypothetical protein
MRAGCVSLHGVSPFEKINKALLNDIVPIEEDEKNRVASFPGNPAVSSRPVAFRPRLAAGLAFFWNIMISIL